MHAGAPSVIATLWQMPDAPLAELMEIFYQHLRAGSSRLAALVQAQRDYLAKHPQSRARPNE